jgi:hypothetical protein
MRNEQVIRSLVVFAVFGLAFFRVPLAIAQQPISTSLCSVMGNPASFAGRLVKFRATVEAGFEISTIVDSNQPTCKGPWFEYAPKKDPQPLYQDGRDAQQQRLHPVFLVEDEKMKRFDDYLDMVVYPRNDRTLFIGGNPHRYKVTATMTGRIDDAGNDRLGFGHMNGWRVRFVLSAVEDVTTEENSYDWTEFSRDPVRFAHGTISGRLTYAQGEPIKSVWIGAIPAEGKIPLTYPEMLTHEDGSYSLDVKPGKYFIVVNRENPANKNVPFPTTYFPSSETEAGATTLNIDDYSDLTDVNIQIHHVLTPRFFEVQVLGADGKAASGAYAYLTQMDRAPIVGHSVTHMDSEGHARLSGFEGIDYLLWADLGSWPNKRCAPVLKLDRSRFDADPIVLRISLTQDACEKQEDEARSAAYATENR